MARNLGPSRNPFKQPDEAQQVCADCSSKGAEWASINRGVLVCSDCCSVHRSLGRHVSEIKYIHDKDWHPHTWNLVSRLSSGGANGVWEHTLLDPAVMKNNKKKPLPSDPVHPVKADFVRAKHQMLSYVLHPPSPSPPHSATCLPPVLGEEEPREGGTSGGPDGEEEDTLSQELHSSVRTANLETSLRLLAQGADPNYFHKGRGNYPLHVAASSGQAEQVELLLVYGAVPQRYDTSNTSPAQVARNAGYGNIAARLIDVELELVNRLLCHLSDQQTNSPPHSQPYRSACSFNPDTSEAVRGHTFYLPRHLISAHQHATDAARQARDRLIKLPVGLLEELAADLYDEVDRRELDQVWSNKRESMGGTGDRCDVPFLPVNPLLSSTRNQARQKLARLKEGELCSLIVDLLVEAERRTAILAPGRSGAPLAAAHASPPLIATAAAGDSDEEPVYDMVCEADDYSLIEHMVGLGAPQGSVPGPPVPVGEVPLHGDYQEVVESLPEDSAAPACGEDSGTNDTMAMAPTSPSRESVVVVVSTGLSPSQQQVVTHTPRGSRASVTPSVHKPRVISQEYERALTLLDHNRRTIQELQSENFAMKTQLNQLATKMQQLRHENDNLRLFGSASSPSTHSSQPSPHQSLPPLHNGNSPYPYEPFSPHHLRQHTNSSLSRRIDASPQTSSPALTFPPPPEYSTPPPSLPYSPGSSSHGFCSSSPRSPPTFNVPSSANNASKEWSRSRPFSMYDSRDQPHNGGAHWRSSPSEGGDNNNDWEVNGPTHASAQRQQRSGSVSLVHQRSASFSENRSGRSCADLPFNDEISSLSSKIAAGIQELLFVVQKNDGEVQPEKYLACSTKIRNAVTNMTSAFQKGGNEDHWPPAIHEALVNLLQTTVALNNLCGTDVSSQGLVEKACAVVKATKDIVSHFS